MYIKTDNTVFQKKNSLKFIANACKKQTSRILEQSLLHICKVAPKMIVCSCLNCYVPANKFNKP